MMGLSELAKGVLQKNLFVNERIEEDIWSVKDKHRNWRAVVTGEGCEKIEAVPS